MYLILHGEIANLIMHRIKESLAGRIVSAVILLTNIFLLSLSLLISPYRVELDIDERLANANGVLVLRVIYILMMVFSTLHFFAFRPPVKMIGIAILLLALFAFVKLALSFS